MCELADNIAFVVANGDDWQCLYHVPCFSNSREMKGPKRTQPCLTLLLMSNGSDELQLLHYSFYAIVEGLSHALWFMLATDLWENLEGSISM